MEISRKLDYALRMLSEVTRVSDGEVVSVRTVSERCGIPYSFARTIQHELVKGGLLATMRGPQGGMRLAVDPTATTLLNIIEVVEGPVCTLGETRVDGERDTSVPTQFDALWDQFAILVGGYFGSVTLEQLALDGLVPHVSASIPYELVPAHASDKG